MKYNMPIKTSQEYHDLDYSEYIAKRMTKKSISDNMNLEFSESKVLFRLMEYTLSSSKFQTDLNIIYAHFKENLTSIMNKNSDMSKLATINELNYLSTLNFNKRNYIVCFPDCFSFPEIEKMTAFSSCNILSL